MKNKVKLLFTTPFWSFPLWYMSIILGSANLSPAFAFTLLFAYGCTHNHSQNTWLCVLKAFMYFPWINLSLKKYHEALVMIISHLKDEKIEKMRDEVIVPWWHI